MCYQSNFAVCTRADSRIGSLCKDLLTKVATTSTLDTVQVVVDPGFPSQSSLPNKGLSQMGLTHPHHRWSRQ